MSEVLAGRGLLAGYVSSPYFAASPEARQRALDMIVASRCVGLLVTPESVACSEVDGPFMAAQELGKPIFAALFGISPEQVQSEYPGWLDGITVVHRMAADMSDCATMPARLFRDWKAVGESGGASGSGERETNSRVERVSCATFDEFNQRLEEKPAIGVELFLEERRHDATYQILARNGQVSKTISQVGKKEPLAIRKLFAGKSWYAPANRYEPEMFTRMMNGLGLCHGPLKDALYALTLSQFRGSRKKPTKPPAAKEPAVKVVEKKRTTVKQGLEPFRTASRQVCGSTNGVALENCPSCSGENTVAVEFIDGAVGYKCFQCDYEFVETE